MQNRCCSRPQLPVVVSVSSFSSTRVKRRATTILWVSYHFRRRFPRSGDSVLRRRIHLSAWLDLENCPQAVKTSRERAGLESARYPCPRCGESISVLANVCRYCNTDINQHPPPLSPPELLARTGSTGMATAPGSKSAHDSGMRGSTSFKPRLSRRAVVYLAIGITVIGALAVAVRTIQSRRDDVNFSLAGPKLLSVAAQIRCANDGIPERSNSDPGLAFLDCKNEDRTVGNSTLFAVGDSSQVPALHERLLQNCLNTDVFAGKPGSPPVHYRAIIGDLWGLRSSNPNRVNAATNKGGQELC